MPIVGVSSKHGIPQDNIPHLYLIKDTPSIPHITALRIHGQSEQLPQTRHFPPSCPHNMLMNIPSLFYSRESRTRLKNKWNVKLSGTPAHDQAFGKKAILQRHTAHPMHTHVSKHSKETCYSWNSVEQAMGIR
ncbi:hypothetical protein Ancab_012208 [Ancistrocladus abbreviatus]